ncbi:hypothetical protein RRG08_053988 [Elysia crispata]|uniref:Uncharacterized protein n=1 Tax=Elysia crispata TaxID=231223 RepID=A0AAE1BCJ7_9GAST|nr:hypothetical protein RRG08_053988 [Elysia crispata]
MPGISAPSRHWELTGLSSPDSGHTILGTVHTGRLVTPDERKIQTGSCGNQHVSLNYAPLSSSKELDSSETRNLRPSDLSEICRNSRYTSKIAAPLSDYRRRRKEKLKTAFTIPWPLPWTAVFLLAIF